MYIQQRKDRNGHTYYSFSYVKDGKRIRLRKDEHPHFTERAKAEEWAKLQDAIRAAEKDHLKKKLSWRDAYYDFDKLLEEYSRWQQSRAPNSYKSCLFYLEQWAFPFFLVHKKAGNVNQWHLFFQEFFDWLQGPHEGRKKKLAASTVNNIVKATNTFLAFLLAYHKIDPAAVRKIPTLPDHLLNHRSHQDVISYREAELVHNEMKRIHPPAADFFRLLFHTGMRFSELFGLSIRGVIGGKVNNKALHDELAKAGISYVGYLFLDRQPLHDDRRRETDGSIATKPLKSMKTISHKNARIIPIRSKEIWNEIIVPRYKAQSAAFEAHKYTTDKHDYPLFDDLEWNRANKTLRQAYQNLGVEPKPYHCCRHSFTTHLVGETRNFFLVRAITGHKKDKSFERYLHIYEQIAVEAAQASQDIDVV